MSTRLMAPGPAVLRNGGRSSSRNEAVTRGIQGLMNLVVGADHAGADLKRELLRRLRREHHAEDLGTRGRRAVDYPDVARAVARRVREGRGIRGLLVCGSALGVCVAANKVPGVRAGTCHDTYSARQGVEHDDLNVLCLGARVIGVELAWEIVQAFLRARFSGESRHRRRVAKIRAMEKEGGLGSAR